MKLQQETTEQHSGQMNHLVDKTLLTIHTICNVNKVGTNTVDIFQKVLPFFSFINMVANNNLDSC